MKKKKAAARMGLSSEEAKGIRHYNPGEIPDPNCGLYTQAVDMNDPAEIEKKKNLLAKYGLNYEDFMAKNISKPTALPPPPELKI
jgi:hypothetical protein